jgi:hypothetical protein
MKHCPTCQRIYTDDTMSYCLEDGTRLLAGSDADSGKTLVLGDSTASSEPPPTEILPPSLAPTVGAQQKARTPTVRQQARPTQQEEQPEAQVATGATQRKSTASLVALTIIATILLLGLGGLGTWLLLRGDVSETARRDEDSKGGKGTDNTPPGSNISNNQLPGNMNASTPQPTPTPLTTPSPTPKPTTDTGIARQEVVNALNRWTQTMRSGNLDAHMANYADTLHTYYLQTNYSASRVRANVAKAFAKYNSFDVKLTNMTVEVDPTGTRAIATFDKTFTFTGATTYSGSGLNRFWLEKIGGRWLITGEKDLKTYYVNN